MNKKNIEDIIQECENIDIKNALIYANKMHRGQTRKDGTDYIYHPVNVSCNVAFYQGINSIELIICAILHDTLEDTEATYNDLKNRFGKKIADLVLELTTDDEIKNKLGKEKYLSIKMENMSDMALIVKLCDRLDNVNDLGNCNSDKFKNKYIKETVGILNYILDNRKLLDVHLNIIEHIIQSLINLCKFDISKTKILMDLLDKYYSLTCEETINIKRLLLQSK